MPITMLAAQRLPDALDTAARIPGMAMHNTRYGNALCMYGRNSYSKIRIMMQTTIIALT